MKVSTIEMPKEKARASFLEYRESLKRRHDDEVLAIMQGYKALAAGQKLLELSKTMRAGGTRRRQFNRVDWRGNRSSVKKVLPKLAIARAYSRYCYTAGVGPSGLLEIRGQEWQNSSNLKDRVRFPAGTFPTNEAEFQPGETFRAMVPIIPPRLRPRGKLDRFHILFEAEWAQHTPPAPVDPILLRHIGGDLYAVLAVWDLTDVERAVLALRKTGGR